MFDTNVAQALAQGHPVPVPFVHRFVDDAYRNAQALHNASIRIKELEEELKRVEGQRNDSNRKIEELQDQIFGLTEKLNNEDKAQ